MMAGLDVTHQFLVTPDRIADIDAIATGTGSRLTAVLADLFRFFSANYVARHEHIAGAALHDPLAVMAITHPDLFTGTERWVAVETRGEHTRGMTVIDQRDLATARPPPARVLEPVDDAAAWQVVVEAVRVASAAH